MGGLVRRGCGFVHSPVGGRRGGLHACAACRGGSKRRMLASYDLRLEAAHARAALKRL